MDSIIQKNNFYIYENHKGKMQLDPIEGEYKAPKAGHKHSSSKQVVCPNCANTVGAQDINIVDKIAKCGSCSQVFSFQNLINSLVQSPSSGNKPTVGKQKDIEIFEYAGEMSISLIDNTDWWALISFTIGFFMLLVTVISASDGGGYLIPTLLGAAFFLNAIHRFIKYRENKIHIDVDDTYLTITPSQRFIQRQKKYLKSDITQVYTKLHPGSTSYTYLYMIHDGPDGEEHVKLGHIFYSRSSALYVEQELEAYLGIIDEPVTEESKF